MGGEDWPTPERLQEMVRTGELLELTGRKSGLAQLAAPALAAVVHHGGAGTTAAAFRAGVRQVVVPFITDQPSWGHRVRRLGVGPPPVPRRKLTAERLAAALLRALDDEGMAARAKELAERIRGEDGGRVAVDVLERELGPASRGRRSA